MHKLNRHFGVVVDSDRKGPEYIIPGCKLIWKKNSETEGGTFFILRKREVENYLHKDAIARSRRQVKPYDDFTDMKKLFGDNVYKVITDMSCEEILERDLYTEDGTQHHELKEIIEALLALPNT